MVKLMLDGLRSGNYGDFEIHHVDARFSDTMAETGGSSFRKVARAFKYAFQAIRFRIRYRATTLYYVPAPPKFAAMARDWIVLGLCRPFFKNVIFHWHAVGLGDWTTSAEKSDDIKNRVAAFCNRLFHGNHNLSLVLTEWGKADVSVFTPKAMTVVGNGIPDPYPDFDSTLLARRRSRIGLLRSGTSTEPFIVAFLGHCTGGKGLWDAMRAVAGVNSKTLPRKLRMILRIAGEFPSDEDRRNFESLRAELTDQHILPKNWVDHIGFVGGSNKCHFLESADCLVFPTRYEAESFGLVAAEALAFGIPPVCSDWRMLPELMEPIGLPVASVGDPVSLADALAAAIGRDEPAQLRAAFLDRFTAEAHLKTLARSLS